MLMDDAKIERNIQGIPQFSCCGVRHLNIPQAFQQTQRFFLITIKEIYFLSLSVQKIYLDSTKFQLFYELLQFLGKATKD